MDKRASTAKSGNGRGASVGFNAQKQMSQDFEKFIGDVEQAVSSAKALPGDAAALARASLEEKIADARSQLNRALRSAGQQTENTLAATNDYIRERPLQALLTAAAIGAVLGLILGRRI